MMKGLVAKMRVSNVQTNDGGNSEISQKVITAAPVCSAEDDPNKEWSKYTPSGSLTLNVTNAAAFPTIDEMAGKTVMVTIEAVD